MWFCTSAHICFAGTSWRPLVAGAWLQRGHLCVSVRAAQADSGSGGSRWQMSGGQRHFPSDTPAVRFSQAIPSEAKVGKSSCHHALAPVVFFPECERVCVFVFPYYPSRFAVKTATKKEEYWSLWLPGPCMPEARACWSEATRWW